MAPLPPYSHPSREAFLVSILVVALGEIGDKTQVATVMLAARIDNLVAVVGGTTPGVLVADVPVVLVGKLAANRIAFKAVRFVAAGLFLILAMVTLLAH